MSDPLRIPLPESIRLRIAEMQQQIARIEADRKLIIDTLLGTQWGPGDPRWASSVQLAPTEIIVLPPAPALMNDDTPNPASRAE